MMLPRIGSKLTGAPAPVLELKSAGVAYTAPLGSVIWSAYEAPGSPSLGMEASTCINAPSVTFC